MDIVSLMDKELVIFDDSIRSKDELFERLAQSMFKSKRIIKPNKFVKDLYKREKEADTGIEDGFGIPHAKSKYVIKPTICFAHTGIIQDYSGLDNQPIEYVFMIAVPEKSNEIHLDILSTLSRKLMNASYRTEIKNISTSEELFKVIN